MKEGEGRKEGERKGRREGRRLGGRKSEERLEGGGGWGGGISEPSWLTGLPWEQGDICPHHGTAERP